MTLEIIILSVIVSAACSICGVFLLLRKMALMSDAVSNSIILGIVIGFFISKSLSSVIPIVGAVTSCLCLNETFYIKYMIAGILAAAGIYIINKS